MLPVMLIWEGGKLALTFIICDIVEGRWAKVSSKEWMRVEREGEREEYENGVTECRRRHKGNQKK